MNILLVEDDVGIGQVLRRGLESLGHPVNWVTQGWEAIELIGLYSYDAIILDLMLPDIDGVELCRTFRRQDVRSAIIILSARDRTEQRIAGLDAGADDYMVKPFSFEELLARLRAQGRRVRETSEIVKLEIEGLVMDVERQSVKVAGKSVALTLREFRLLEFLMRNKGRVVSRESIMCSVWGGDADVSFNTVDVYIGYLRRKCGLQDRIVTTRGLGFQLLAKSLDKT